MHFIKKLLQLLHPIIILFLVHIIEAKYVKHSVLYSKVLKDIIFCLLFKWRTSRWLEKTLWIRWKRLILYACLSWQKKNFQFLDKFIVSIFSFLWNWGKMSIQENFLRKDEFWKLSVPKRHFADTSMLCCGLSLCQRRCHTSRDVQPACWTLPTGKYKDMSYPDHTSYNPINHHSEIFRLMQRVMENSFKSQHFTPPFLKSEK